MSSQASATTAPEKMWSGGHSPFNMRWGKMYMWIFLISDAFTFSSLIIAYGALRHRFADIWPDPDLVFTHFPFIHAHVPLMYVGLMTFILIMSSVTMVLAVDAGHRLKKAATLKWLGWTIVGGFLFLGSQAWEWYHFIKGSPEGAYVLADGRFARTDYLEPGILFFNDGTRVVGAEAEALKATAVKNIIGANLKENEYGNTPLFGDFFFFITGFHGFHVFSGVVLNIIVFIMVWRGVLERKKDYELVEKVGLYWHFVDLVWVFVFTFFYLV
ncbi:MAG: cytochrome oxidase subunit III [Bacteroidetes bacterium]|nr:MAG: cytochrome oxidase subunit III [Bacteroidota bacterium]REK04921.1 MAG: cytochrome oxidase subunit III [Bacteroidota bacterium]REK32870.1 MAG: cytochrome oxidase subunit III [Bacteroidota bacterium]REK50941.1 MAG: cytochrome oxidase subunit III [Bacteroidota bacterium]